MLSGTGMTVVGTVVGTAQHLRSFSWDSKMLWLIVSGWHRFVPGLCVGKWFLIISQWAPPFKMLSLFLPCCMWYIWGGGRSEHVTAHIWRSEESLVELILIFHLSIGSLSGVGSKHLYPLSHLTRPKSHLLQALHPLSRITLRTGLCLRLPQTQDPWEQTTWEWGHGTCLPGSVVFSETLVELVLL